MSGGAMGDEPRQPPPIPAVTVIDAGVGNLGNLARALRHLGADVEVTRDAARIREGRCLVLPGVGAFRPPRERLRGAREAALRAALDDGAWLLGICVGFQLLFASSDEFGDTDGLGLLPGTVTHLPDRGVALPHIGWNPLRDLATGHPLLEGIDAGTAMYFVHSFATLDVPKEARIADALHGVPFNAIAGRGRVLGTQFHPEKSGDDGLRLLGNYLRLATTETTNEPVAVDRMPVEVAS